MSCNLIYSGVLFSVFICCIVASDPRVSSKVGEFIGTTVKVNVGGVSYTVNQYLGIKYAKPPVGERRFRKPEAYGEYNSPYHAVNYGFICPQVYNPMESLVGTEDEDCLHLNVVVPVQNPDQPSGHAVMVRIPGGGFILGSSDEYEGLKPLASVGNVIVVTLNYRLGPLGFISSMDSNLKGNLGLWDQHFAIKWVRDNIESFGGDTNRITIFGESAGAISAVIHGMYPGNAGLFQRIIAESGSPSVRSMHCSRNTLTQLIAIADKFGCVDEDTGKILACLRIIPWKKYMAEVNAMTENFENIDNVFFDPIVDDEFLKYEPRNVSEMAKTQTLSELEFFRSQFDFLAGMNAYEGATYVPYFVGNEDPEQFEPTPEDMKNLLLTAIDLVYNRTFPNEIMKMVENEYTDWSNPTDFRNIRLQYMRIFGDTGFGVPTVEYARLHTTSTKSKTFMFKFMPIPTTRRLSTPSWTPGADHGENVYFLLGMEGKPNVTEWEKELSILMMRYWTNFAKSGDPNKPVQVEPEWPEYELDTQYYMALDKNMDDNSVKQFLYARESEFWLELFPAMVSAFDKFSDKPERKHDVPKHTHDDL